jgi:integrase
VLALSTGTRSSEVRGLRWHQVSLDRGWITLEETKNGHRRGVPLEMTMRNIFAKSMAERALPHEDDAIEAFLLD